MAETEWQSFVRVFSDPQIIGLILLMVAIGAVIIIKVDKETKD